MHTHTHTRARANTATSQHSTSHRITLHHWRMYMPRGICRVPLMSMRDAGSTVPTHSTEQLVKNDTGQTGNEISANQRLLENAWEVCTSVGTSVGEHTIKLTKATCHFWFCCFYGMFANRRPNRRTHLPHVFQQTLVCLRMK